MWPLKIVYKLFINTIVCKLMCKLQTQLMFEYILLIFGQWIVFGKTVKLHDNNINGYNLWKINSHSIVSSSLLKV